MMGLIDQLDCELARSRPDYYSQLQSGVDLRAIHDLLTRLAKPLPPEFVSLYSWRNGQKPDCSASLIDNWMFSPLEDVISTKDMLDGMIGTDFEEPSWWSRDWIPFLSNGGGDHLCLDLFAGFGGSPGQIITFRHDWENRSAKFPNMESWLQSVVNSLAESD